MGFSKTNTEPVNQQTFQRHIKFALACHLAFVALFFIFSQFAGGEIFRYGVYAMTFFYFMFSMHIFQSFHPTRRFKDIYEGEELKASIFTCMALFPPLFLGFLAHLYFKNKSEKPAPKIFTHFGYFSLMFLSLIGVSLINPKVTYWTASPSSYYFIDLIHSAHQVIELKDNPPKTEETIYKTHLKMKSGNVSATEIVLLTAVSLRNLSQREKVESADPKADKDALRQKYTRMFVHDIADSLVRFEKSKLHFTDYSIVQWISPGAALEIFLLSTVDEMIKEPLAEKMAASINGIVGKMEEKIASLPIEKKAGYQLLLQTAKTDLSKSYNYRSIASEK